MLRDEEFSMSSTLSINPPEPVYENDDLDDVFGSAPGSPSFGGEQETVSDIPRLKEKHETDGYRDGVTQGKAQSVQKGFDEGYGLGAVLGLEIGRMIGILEGLFGAVTAAASKNADMWSEEVRRMEDLLRRAKEELKTEKVFGREWWDEDGIWKFEVPGEDVVFPDVAAAHPLVKQWGEIIRREIEKWTLDMKLMEGNDNADPDDGPVRPAAPKADLNW
ncbi:ABC1 domain containing protein [Rutstroemia sp. NJR-2017a BVV2]|nr:ABC1 domain containing protein [Rutstroemia sp. NJR-2017a BVV2]